MSNWSDGEISQEKANLIRQKSILHESNSEIQDVMKRMLNLIPVGISLVREVSGSLEFSAKTRRHLLI